MKKILISSVLILSYLLSFTQNDTIDKNIKTGWNLGVLPVIAYDSDLGLKYGGLVSFYNYGDGKMYPKYDHLIAMEINRTTKGSGTNQLFFDSDKIFKKDIRVTADLSYLTEQALDFYGFNGIESLYTSDFEDDASSVYKSRMYYRYARKMFRFTCDFQGDIIPNKLRWIAGFGNYTTAISSVDIDRLNKGKSDDDKLPAVPSLYDEYVSAGLIGQNEADGGMVNLIKAGVIYDTRDNESCPMKGMWTELLFATAPRFLYNTENPYTKLIFIHRQYFTLIKNRLSFVYRLGYQGTISGDAPFYMQSLMLSSYSSSTIVEGLGGAKSLRGILRDRVIGDGIAWSNICLRWKFYRCVIAKQNIYFAINTFVDAGTVVQKQRLDYSFANFTAKEDNLHLSYGGGLHVAMNENFVLSINYGLAHSEQDGKSGLYFGTSWLF